MSPTITAHSSWTQHVLVLAIAASSLAPAAAPAAYRDDIGFTTLQAELGTALPDGAGVPVTQVEGNALPDTGIAYFPDPGNGEFAGKTLVDVSALSTAYSAHATGVGQFLYGNTLASASGITDVDGYLADDWLTSGFLNVAAGVPDTPQPDMSGSRMANHSWVGTTESAADDSNMLRRVDWLVDRDEFVQVVGYVGAAAGPLLSSAYNVIAVDRTGAITTAGSAAVDGTYIAGRTRPDLVAPADSPSNAVPMVASATAILIDLAQSNPSLSTDPVARSTSNRNGDTIYNASRSEVLKVALLAGADRATHNTADADIAGYRVNAADQTNNGLDRRYGAGQLNIDNSYHIVAAGEQNSAEDGGPAVGNLGRGFDYDPAFGGLNGSNSAASYVLPVSAASRLLTASLAWNLTIDGGSPGSFDGTADLRDLALSIIDITNPVSPVTVFTSQSPSDNTENAWLVIPAGRQFMLRVTRGSGSSFTHDYAIAWQLLPDLDADGAYDERDNCIAVANGPIVRDAGGNTQLDADRDGYGNSCDADLNNSGLTTATDFNLLRSVLNMPAGGSTLAAAADINGSGLVTAADFNLLRARINTSPGPSGLVP